MNVAAYIRVSTDEQSERGNSLFEQTERLTAYCKAMGWPKPAIYEDDGYSAKDLNRPAMSRLLEDVKQKKYNMILTTKIDRISRKLIDLLNLIDYFRRYDTFYSSSSESFDTSTPVGMMTLQILGSVAEFERERIRERVRENLLSLAKQGKLYSKPAYGYNVINGVYEVNIEESLIVKDMFRWTLEGKGPIWIAGQLNAMGIPSKNGTLWDEKRIRMSLQLEAYIGQFIYNRKYRKGTVEVTRPEEEWIVIEDHHEPIIDEDTFHKVQDIIRNRKRASRKYFSDEKYLLTGLVYCTHCGEKMNGRQIQRPRSKTADKYEYRYLCSGYAKKAICSYHSILRDDLEAYVIEEIKQLTEHSPDRLKEMKIEEPEKKISERDLLESKLHKLDQRMQKQIEGWEMDLISADDLKKARKRIDDERRVLQEAIEKHDQAAAASEQMKVQNKARDLIEDIMSEDRIVAKRAIAQIISRIEIRGGEEVSITFQS